MPWIIAWSLKFRMAVVVAAVAISAIGIAQLRSAPVDVLPEFTPPYVEIQTEANGLSADEVEQLITVPLEADLLNGVQGVEVIRSRSLPGLSSVVLVFEPGTDVYRGRQLVQERLTQLGGAAWPMISKPSVVLPPLSSSSRVLMIGLSSSELTPICPAMSAANSMEFLPCGTIVVQFAASGRPIGTATIFLRGASRSVCRYNVPLTTPSGRYAAV